jgi:hypothetical protein
MSGCGIDHKQGRQKANVQMAGPCNQSSLDKTAGLHLIRVKGYVCM